MKKSFIKPILYFFLFLGLVVLGFVVYHSYAALSKPMILAADVPLIVEIKPRSTAHGLINTLYEKNLIHSKKIFLKYISFKGIANRLKAGIYQVKPGESAENFLARVVAGDVLVLSFSIIEGTTIEQITQHMKNAPFLQYQESDWSTISSPEKGLIKNQRQAEGLLLADTYNYQAGSQAKNLLQTANKNLLHYLQQSWNTRSLDLPYANAYELLIVASILEKETAIAREQQLISGVIVNRLRKHMPLQMDPTVIYALGTHYTGRLSHMDMSIDSPYNTYRYRGLPLSPIAMVAKAAIDAAAHPILSDYLYFVAKGDGTHQFSKTYQDQKSAVDRYQIKGSP